MSTILRLILACIAVALWTHTAWAQASLYFIHPDHLNTPRLVANAAGTTVWKWDQQEPFGDNVADENPSGLGTFDLALRLPGQYFDKETNLHYNYFRNYDSPTGRYIQSDPLGLRASLNTFAYTGSRPLRHTDFFGLAPLSQCEKDILGFYFPPDLLEKIDIQQGIPWYGKLGAVDPVAFTVGTTIYFAPGQYEPSSAAGLSLLGHEVTHSQQYGQHGFFGFLNRYANDYQKNIDAGMSPPEAYAKIPFEQQASQKQREMLDEFVHLFGSEPICRDRCGR